MQLWHWLSRDGRDMVRSWTISLIKTLSFCIMDLAWAAIGGSFLSECVCVHVKAWNHILLCINMQGIKNAQLGIVWCQWKEIYLKVMVHSCRSFGVWAWQIVVVQLVIAHKHTHTHMHINIYVVVSVRTFTNTKAQVNKVRLNMYTKCAYVQTHGVCCSAVMLFGCSALQ